jgi:hypothetical protein
VLVPRDRAKIVFVLVFVCVNSNKLKVKKERIGISSLFV